MVAIRRLCSRLSGLPDYPVRRDQEEVGVARQDRQEHWVVQDRPVREALARLALLELALPGQQELDRPVLVEDLARKVIQALQARRAPPDQPVSVPVALQAVWDRLVRPDQVQLAQQETPAVQEMWELQDQAEQLVQGRRGQREIPELLAALGRPGQPVSQGLKVRQVLQAARGRPGPRVLSAQQATQAARELLDQQDQLVARGHKA